MNCMEGGVGVFSPQKMRLFIDEKLAFVLLLFLPAISEMHICDEVS